MEDERPKADEEPEEDEQHDTEGQALTWKVRKPIPEAAADDTEGQGMRPPPDVVDPMPGVDDDDEVEGHGGVTGSPRPPVD
jgi:hypothetical protein